MEKTAKGLVEYAKAQLGRPYWYGTFGQAASRSLYNQKKKQYPGNYEWDYAGETEKVHDCIGLVKGYLWCDGPQDKTPAYTALQDLSANGMRDACTRKGGISSIPDVPGVLVFMNQHVGVYIGGGEVIEARGHAYGIVKTKLSARPWATWGYCPYVTYETTAANTSNNTKGVCTVDLPVLKKGAKSETVKAMQQLLLAKGYKMKNGLKTYSADGSFGKATENALKNYQRAKGLEVDGSCGPITWRSLLGLQ